MKSADRIYKEIIFYKENHNIDRFAFEHDMFVTNRELVLDLCKRFEENEVKIKWGCSARIDILDEELLKNIISAGCDSIFFGIESGSQKMQKVIKKNLDLVKVKEKIELISRYDIKAVFSFIYGFPQECDEDIEETLNLIKYIQDRFKRKIYDNKFTVQLHKLMYLPKTEVTEMYKKELVHTDNFRMEIFKSIDTFNDKELSRLTSDLELFPNLCYVRTPLTDKTMNIDRFMIFIKVVFMKYNNSYNYILQEFQNNLLRFYYSFMNSCQMETLNRYADEDLLAEGNSTQEYAILENYIKEIMFKNINSQLLLELLEFEHYINELIYKKNDDDRFWIKKFRYNVIGMIKNNNIDEKIGDYFIQFTSKDKKAGVKYV